MFVEIMVVALAILVVFLLLLVVKMMKNPIDVSKCFEQKIGEIRVYNDGIKDQYAKLQTEMERNVGELKTYATDVRSDYRSLDALLRVPQQRGALGEIALETILSDQLPPEMFGIRKRVFGKNPDAYINSIAGVICVDSKFPLDNFKKMIETNDASEKDGYKNEFLKNIRGHLQKIKDDYISPQAGTTDFAFAFIPSESVFWYLISEMHDELMQWAKLGVQVVSPLTISSKIALVKAGVHAKKLSEDAGKILVIIERLKRSFDAVDNDWKTFFSSHLTNAWKKAQTVDESYKKLRQEFDKVEKLED